MVAIITANTFIILLVAYIIMLVKATPLGTAPRPCPIGVKRCYRGYDYSHYDMRVNGEMWTIEDNEVACIDHCKQVPGCIGCAFHVRKPHRCYCKLALDSTQKKKTTHTDSFAFADSTPLTSANSSRCQDMQDLKMYVTKSNQVQVQCGDEGDEIYFGDLDGDNVCDVLCWNQYSKITKWAKGDKALGFGRTVSLSLGISCGIGSKSPYSGTPLRFAHCPFFRIAIRDGNNDGIDELGCIATYEHQTEEEIHSATKVTKMEKKDSNEAPYAWVCYIVASAYFIAGVIITLEVVYCCKTYHKVGKFPWCKPRLKTCGAYKRESATRNDQLISGFEQKPAPTAPSGISRKSQEQSISIEMNSQKDK